MFNGKQIGNDTIGIAKLTGGGAIAAGFLLAEDAGGFVGVDPNSLGGGGGGSLQQTVMFSSNLDNVKTIYYFGKIVISVVNSDSVILSSVGFESSTDGVNFTSESNLTNLNAFIAASGTSSYYIRYTATYQSGKTETTGAQLTYTVT